MSTPLVIGSSGFIGRHVRMRLFETNEVVLSWRPSHDMTSLADVVKRADVIYHCAGATRTETPTAWDRDMAVTRCMIANLKPTAKVVYASSLQSGQDSHYGSVKQQSEIELAAWSTKNPAGSVWCPRLPNVYGKWAKPHHNSIVATWCHQLAKGEELSPVTSDQPSQYMHIDTVVDALLSPNKELHLPSDCSVTPSWVQVTLRDGLANPAEILACPWISTVWSYQDPLAATENTHEDHRGVFYEFSKQAGQVNYLTIRPHQIRGNHWHHNRIETFVLYGRGLRLNTQHSQNSALKKSFGSDDTYPVRVTVPPGWTHKLTNSSNRSYMVPLWTSDQFDPENPDTVRQEIL